MTLKDLLEKFTRLNIQRLRGRLAPLTVAGAGYRPPLLSSSTCHLEYDRLLVVAGGQPSNWDWPVMEVGEIKETAYRERLAEIRAEIDTLEVSSASKAATEEGFDGRWSPRYHALRRAWRPAGPRGAIGNPLWK